MTLQASKQQLDDTTSRTQQRRTASKSDDGATSSHLTPNTGMTTEIQNR